MIGDKKRAREASRAKYRASEKYRAWAQDYYSRPDVLARRREYDARRKPRKEAPVIITVDGIAYRKVGVLDACGCQLAVIDPDGIGRVLVRDDYDAPWRLWKPENDS